MKKIERRVADYITKRHGLYSFSETYSPKKSIIVCNEREKRVHNKIDILPWEVFLNQLWAGKVI